MNKIEFIVRSFLTPVRDKTFACISKACETRVSRLVGLLVGWQAGMLVTRLVGWLVG